MLVSVAESNSKSSASVEGGLISMRARFLASVNRHIEVIGTMQCEFTSAEDLAPILHV